MKELLKTVLRFALWAMLFFVTMFAGAIVLAIINPSVLQGSEQAVTDYFKDSASSGWISLAVTLLFIILFLILRWANLSKGILERRFMWKLVGLLVLLTVADICFEVFLADLPAYHNLFPESWAELEADDGTPNEGITRYLYVCLLVPIFEEIGFRGVLLGGLLRAKWHPWLAIPLSALVFALFHLSAISFIGLTLGGIIYGWLFWRTKSLIPSMICHIANNTIALCAGPIMMYITGSKEIATSPTTDVIVIVIAITLMLFVLTLINRMVPKRLTGEEVNERSSTENLY